MWGGGGVSVYVCVCGGADGGQATVISCVRVAWARRHVARMFGVSTTITYDMFIADVVGGTAAIRPGFRGALYTFPPKRFSVAMNIALGTQELSVLSYSQKVAQVRF